MLKDYGRRKFTSFINSTSQKLSVVIKDVPTVTVSVEAMDTDLG